MGEKGFVEKNGSLIELMIGIKKKKGKKGGFVATLYSNDRPFDGEGNTPEKAIRNLLKRKRSPYVDVGILEGDVDNSIISSFKYTERNI